MTSPSTEILLTAKGLYKTYSGGKFALRGVDLVLRAGEWLALLGPNGAGKTTLLQLLSGLFTPDRGIITVLGHDMRLRPSRALAGMGAVFQESALDLDLSVMSNLLFHTDLHGIPRAIARRRIDEKLAEFGLQKQLNSIVRNLSGGTRRKVELMRALLHCPRILLMDEATVGLDMVSREQMLKTIPRLCREEGIAVLWATHLIEEVRSASRVLLLHHGAVRFDGPSSEFMTAGDSEAIQVDPHGVEGSAG